MLEWIPICEIRRIRIIQKITTGWIRPWVIIYEFFLLKWNPRDRCRKYSLVLLPTGHIDMGLSQSDDIISDITCLTPSCQATAPPHLNCRCLQLWSTLCSSNSLIVFSGAPPLLFSLFTTTMAFCITFGTHGKWFCFDSGTRVDPVPGMISGCGYQCCWRCGWVQFYRTRYWL